MTTDGLSNRKRPVLQTGQGHGQAESRVNVRFQGSRSIRMLHPWLFDGLPFSDESGVGFRRAVMKPFQGIGRMQRGTQGSSWARDPGLSDGIPLGFGGGEFGRRPAFAKATAGGGLIRLRQRRYGGRGVEGAR